MFSCLMHRTTLKKLVLKVLKHYKNTTLFHFITLPCSVSMALLTSSTLNHVTEAIDLYFSTKEELWPTKLRSICLLSLLSMYLEMKKNNNNNNISIWHHSLKSAHGWYAEKVTKNVIHLPHKEAATQIVNVILPSAACSSTSLLILEHHFNQPIRNEG